MPVHKYFCPECGLVLQSDTDVTNQSLNCLGCQTVFIARPMNRPSAAESAVLRAPSPPPKKPKTDVPKPVQAPPSPTPAPRPSTVQRTEPPQPAPAPQPRPSALHKPEPPTAAPRTEPPLEEPPRRKTGPPPPPPAPRPSSRSSVKLKRPAPPVDEEEEIISLAPVRKKKRWPLVVAVLGVLFVFAGGGAAALWFFVFSGSSEMKFKAESPDKAWTVKLPDTPQTNETKADSFDYLYKRPDKDAEFNVVVGESPQPNPDEMLDLGAGLMFAAVAQKYELGQLALALPKADMSKYNGQYARRLYEVDTGSRGKLTVQLIVVNWPNGKSTTITQVAIGKDISDSERKAFFNSVEIKKAAR
jgi:hypothetical protein